jgi:hypothetical protein
MDVSFDSTVRRHHIISTQLPRLVKGALVVDKCHLAEAHVAIDIVRSLAKIVA